MLYTPINLRLPRPALALLSVLLLGCPPAEAPPNTPPGPPSDTPEPDDPKDPDVDIADWTFLVFMNGDNDLEAYVFYDLNELERAGSTEDLNIIVQADRVDGHYTGDGDWTGTRRYYVTQDDTPGVVSEMVEDLGELDMGDPQVLSDAMIWAHENYPAEKMAVILWNHGDGWSMRTDDGETGIDPDAFPEGGLEGFEGTLPPPMISSDETSGSGIDIAQGELAEAFEEIVELRGKVDVVGFDACLMGAWEVAHVLQPYAHTMVASETSVGMTGYQYDLMLPEIAAAPESDAATMADLLAWSAVEGNEQTQAAIDLSKLSALTSAIDNLANVVLNDATLQSDLLSARSDTNRLEFGWHDYYLDLGHFAEHLSDESRSRLSSEGTSIREALDETLISLYTNQWFTWAGGLSIYADTNQVYLDDYANGAGATWSQETQWDEMLEALED